MPKKKYEKLTSRTLSHVLNWGRHMATLQSWTKSDALTYHLIEEEIKRLRHDEYIRQQMIEQTPYLDPEVPYNMT